MSDDCLKALHLNYYRPQRSCGQGNIFTPVCHSVHGGGGFCLNACWDTNPPGPDPPRPGTHHRPGADTPQSRPPPGTRSPPDLHTHTPPPSRSPPEQTPPGTPPGSRHPPPGEADSSIRSTSGRYASYWNAFLFKLKEFELMCRSLVYEAPYQFIDSVLDCSVHSCP